MSSQQANVATFFFPTVSFLVLFFLTIDEKWMWPKCEEIVMFSEIQPNKKIR